jgi:8-oxo-dGTP pyrophosphatase MutT (NUDIX family)
MTCSKPAGPDSPSSQQDGPPEDRRVALLERLATHADSHPERADVVAEFAQFVRANFDCAERWRAAGHLTGSAFVVSGDGQRAVLLHHRKLDRWLQPGGHADGELDLALVALREAREETGLTGLVVEAEIFDLDRHWIPQRGPEAGHWHYDVRFLVRAGPDERIAHNAESRAVRWRAIREIAHDPGIDESVARLARYWLERQRR